MRPGLGFKILTVFAILLAFWFFYRVVRLLLPLLIMAIVIGYLWDLMSRSNKKNNKYDDYEEID